MVLYFRVKNRAMNQKKNYSIYKVKIGLRYYIVENRIPLKHFYYKLYLRGENRVTSEKTGEYYLKQTTPGGVYLSHFLFTTGNIAESMRLVS